MSWTKKMTEIIKAYAKEHVGEEITIPEIAYENNIKPENLYGSVKQAMNELMEEGYRCKKDDRCWIIRSGDEDDSVHEDASAKRNENDDNDDIADYFRENESVFGKMPGLKKSLTRSSPSGFIFRMIDQQLTCLELISLIKTFEKLGDKRLRISMILKSNV